MHNKKTKGKRGIALLISILLSAFIILVAMSIHRIALKGFALSTISSEGQKAFYIADALAECGLYIDVKGGGLDATGNVTCFGQNTTVAAAPLPAVATYAFNFNNPAERYCGRVQLEILNSSNVPDVNGGRSRLTAVGKSSCGFYNNMAERAIILDY